MQTEYTSHTYTTIAEDTFWNRPATNYALWTSQVLLAVLFLFAGSMKFIMPVEEMTKQIPLSGTFLRFIGVAELLGAVGLVIPWLLDIRRELTALAAFGLVIIMIGATVLTAATGTVAGAGMPFTVGVLLLLVAYGRGPASSNVRKRAGAVDFASAHSSCM